MLGYVTKHGPCTAHSVAFGLGREPGAVNALLRKLESQDKVRRVGLEPTGHSRPRIVYEATNDDVEVREMGTELVEETVDATPGRQLIPAGAEEVDLRANDLEELLGGWAGSLTLADADTGALEIALRVRKVLEVLRDVEANE